MTSTHADGLTLVDTRRVTGGRPYTVADLFCGAGGMTLGFVTAGYEPVLAVESDPAACATHRANFPAVSHHEGLVEDLTEDAALDMLGGRELHVLCAGTPCQGFSTAGRRDPEDGRNHLFREFVRLARALRPWFVVMENVPGLLSLEGGAFHRSLVEAFAEIGHPGMTVRTLEAAAYGVPQLRRRAMFIANRFGVPNPYPQPVLRKEEFVSVEVALDDLKDHPRDPSINHEWTRHSPETEARLARVLPGETLYAYHGSWRRLRLAVPAPTIKHNHGAPHIHHELPRTISAREMARLQSFPDEFLFEGDMAGVMTQVGNAVPPLLARHVALALRPSLDELTEHRSREP